MSRIKDLCGTSKQREDVKGEASNQLRSVITSSTEELFAISR